MKDLIVLTADKNTEFLLRGLLPRLPAIEGLGSFSFDIYVHPLRDAGVFNNAVEFLRPFISAYRYALVVFDLEGSGREGGSREDAETNLENKIGRNGWESRIAVIVVEPEIENWVWVGSPHLHAVLNWSREMDMYDWLREKGLLEENSPKPPRPKEVFEKILAEVKMPRSSSIYKQLAARAGYRRCVDAGFLKMIAKLRDWFGK